MSVSFSYNSVINRPCFKVTFVSKNVTDLLDHSAVNFIVGCSWFSSSTNLINSCSSCGQIMNTSSMYLHHTSGFNVVSVSNLVSSLPINKLAYEGAIFVPITVPCSWRKCSPLKVK